MSRLFAILAAAVLLFAGVVWFSLRQPLPPRGYSGLEFAAMTPADAARTPMLAKGAVILSVAPGSPADKVGIEAGDVVAAIDGVTITSARQASDRIGAARIGQKAALTLYDVTRGEVRPDKVELVLAAEPDPQKTGKFSVNPPPTLAKESFARPPIAANAAWARRLSRGAFIEPQPLFGLGAGRCNGLAPEGWRVADFATDGTLFHVMAPATFQHAIAMKAALNGAAPAAFIQTTLAATFQAPVTLSPPRAEPFGFTLISFGNTRGGAGFVEYRVRGGRIELWIAAVAAAESGWALPITGAVAFSLNCGSATASRDTKLAVTSVSAQCLAGKCQDSDFAAAYMKSLRLGFVHDPKWKTYLINPKRDLWLNGAQGPGYYHQVSGENEKLEPGRTN